MSRRTRVPAWLAITLVPALLALGSAVPGQAQEHSGPAQRQDGLRYRRVAGGTAATSRLAQSDTSLLGRTDAAQVEIVVKLDYDSLATYAGEIPGYRATSPAVTGKPLTGGAAERRYEDRIAGQEKAFVGELNKRVHGVKIGQRLRTVYGGVALRVPANRIDDVLKIPGVVAVQKNELAQPLTDSAPTFLGATSIYPRLGGAAAAGKGVIIGLVDSGVWPEHPSFADQGNLEPPPPTLDGTPRACDFGDNPLTEANDVFQCNNKLIGGRTFLDGYLSIVQRASAEKYRNARDSQGHGTHTASTAAGDVLRSATVVGTERGPLQGVAPGAWVSVYKTCGSLGCLQSDTAAAVQRAIKDGVEVLNCSLSGGTKPATDPVELAFLDAYAAGVFVTTSAGNSGPAAGTSDHLSPWVTTVGASTQRREFRSTLTLTGADGVTGTFTGVSITDGVSTPASVVLSKDATGYANELCDEPAPAGSLTGKIVACARGVVARVVKGYNVEQGGAVGMIVYNPTLGDANTDNHWLPAVHLADGTSFLAFMAAHQDATGTFTAGARASGVADAMATFSSRGPRGTFIKPDVTAPGVQILAGNTPTPDAVENGVPGQYFQVAAGTSMSAPMVAGSAALIRAMHPDWSPGQIKSALLTTATTQVVKEDLKTPADPFDFGAGRIRDAIAGNPGLTFDETAENMRALGNDPVNGVQLNLPSVNAPVMPGGLTAVRVARNVSGRSLSYRVQTTAPARSSVTVSPSRFTVPAGGSVTLRITIRSTAPTAQYFGEVRLVPAARSGVPTLHLPVAFVPRQGDVSLVQSCTPGSISQYAASTCTVTAQNNAYNDTTVSLETVGSSNLRVAGVTGGAKIAGRSTVELASVPLDAALPRTPSLQATQAGGYVPVSAQPIAIGDEQFINLSLTASGLGPVNYNGEQYTTIGVNSNGYLVPGGGTAQDNSYLPAIPSRARPNNVIAPFWTDLDGTGAPGILVAVRSFDGTDQYLAIEWRVNVAGTDHLMVFEAFLRLASSATDRTQDIWFSYKPDTIVDPATVGTPGQTFAVGAENAYGSGGGRLPVGALPAGDLRVVSADPVPGATVSYTVTLQGVRPGVGEVTTTMVSPSVPGGTIVSNSVSVHSGLVRRR